MGIAAIRLRRRVRGSELPENVRRYEELLERCKRRLGVRRRVRVVLQSHVGTPALMGLLRPVILLPEYAAGMSDARLEYVILHELSHLKRGDGLVNALLLALRAVYWFNPLVWLLLKFVREDMELANDAAVLRGMGQEARKEYSLSLVEVLMGCGKQRHSMLCMTDGKKNIERRIGMIQLGEFFKRRKWVIAAAGVLVIAGIAALFLTSGVKPKQAGSQNALMSTLGYTKEALEAIQKNKTPYVGENAKVGAIIYQLPVTWKGLAYDSFSLQTKEEPYGLTIHYKEAEGTDYYENPFYAAMEENNALLLFASIGNLGEVTFAMPGDMQSSKFTRGEISAIFGGIPSIDDLDAVYDKLSKNLKMEEFYFAHAGRLYLRTATPEDVVYRYGGEPEKLFVNESGLTVYEYHISTTYTDMSGQTSTIDEKTEYFYFDESGLYAVRTLTEDEPALYNDVIAKFGPPAGEKNIDGQKIISYLLRRDTPGEPDKYAFFVFENGKSIESGWMLGDDFTVLSTAQAGPAATQPPTTAPDLDNGTARALVPTTPPSTTTTSNRGNYARAHANAAALEALFPKNRSGEPIYPDFIGGIYYNGDFNMVLQLVESAKAKDAAQYSRVEGFLAQADGIIVEHVDFSDNELEAVMDILGSYWTADNKPDVFKNVDTCRKDTINNRVEVWLRVYNEEEIARFRETVLDSPMLVFVQSRGTPTLL